VKNLSYCQIHSVAFSTTVPLWANLSQSAPSPFKAVENDVAGSFKLPFHSQTHARKLLKT
jgi:hypothetical protein